MMIQFCTISAPFLMIILAKNGFPCMLLGATCCQFYIHSYFLVAQTKKTKERKHGFMSPEL